MGDQILGLRYNFILGKNLDYLGNISRSRPLHELNRVLCVGLSNALHISSISYFFFGYRHSLRRSNAPLHPSTNVIMFAIGCIWLNWSFLCLLGKRVCRCIIGMTFRDPYIHATIENLIEYKARRKEKKGFIYNNV